MYEKLEKLEQLLTDMFDKFIALIFVILHKVFPKVLFDKYHALCKRISNFKANLISKFIQLLKLIKQKTIEFFNNTKNLALRIKEKNPAEKIKNFLLKSINILRETPLKKQLGAILNIFKPLFDYTYKKLKKYYSPEGAIFTTIFVIVGIAALGIFQSTRNIYQSEYPTRKPASVQEYDRVPEYKMYKRKTVTFQNLKVPVTIKSVSGISSVTIDFSVRTSTRLARYLLENFEYKLKDHFFTRVLPVEASSPLSEEGKLLIKETISREVKNFLDENKIEGEVEEVRILFIVAS